MSKVVVIGGGAAGMMASIIAARNGHTVTLIEKNDKLGKKLFITGKGRCNFTNAGDEDDIKNSVVTNPKFMYSSFKGFSNYDVMGFFDELGLKFKIERGNRCFSRVRPFIRCNRHIGKRIKKMQSGYYA